MNEKYFTEMFDHILQKCPDAIKIDIRSDGLLVERAPAAPAVRHVTSVAPAAPVLAPAAPAVPDGIPVISPLVGTFYAAAAPDAPPFVKVGQRVRKGQTLCIVEAMKAMNEIECDHEGEVLQILAQNGDLVEYGQTLMVIQ